jgi:hypothetical protein
LTEKLQESHGIATTLSDTHWLEHPAPVLRSRASDLPWKLTAGPHLAEQKVSFGLFSKMLKEAQILDSTAVDVTGCAVVLPYGVELLTMFRSIVRKSYIACGLSEYEYPCVMPTTAAEPISTLIDLEENLMLVGTKHEMSNQTCRTALLPSGEATIYSHWSKRVSSRKDLPIRMFQRARYFRPVHGGRHGGRGPFYSIEHDDVFEFHCAHAETSEQKRDYDQLRVMVDDLISMFCVPVLWSTRPPWTNRSEVANLVVGADTPLPSQSAAQISCVYDQGRRFSSLYKVGFREGGVNYLTEQIAGYVSRRLVLTHLLLGMQHSSNFFVHPSVSPVSVLILTRSSECATDVRAFATKLTQENIRTRVVTCETVAALHRTRSTWHPRGVPITVQLFTPRSDQDSWKVVINRGDTGEEVTLHCGQLAHLIPHVQRLIDDLSDSFRRIAYDFARSRVARVDRAGLHDALDSRLIAITPLKFSEETVRGIAELRKGEVLGFCTSDGMERCSWTGNRVKTVALISPRL